MCGVFGFVSRNGGKLNLEILGRIAEATERRGPHVHDRSARSEQTILLPDHRPLDGEWPGAPGIPYGARYPRANRGCGLHESGAATATAGAKE